MPRVLKAQRISAVVAQLYHRACVFLPPDVERALQEAWAREQGHARLLLQELVENARYARETGLPLCQDTGLALVMLDMGQDICLSGETLQVAVDRGVAQACRSGYLRASVVSDPIHRGGNTGDNTPALIHCCSRPGSRLHLTVAARGGGSENMGRVFMLPPDAGEAGVRQAVLEAVQQGAARACPPLVVGVGVGGTMEMAALAAKRASLRPLDSPAATPDLARLEKTMLEEVNALGIGPQGVGGYTTALAVHFSVLPAHIATLPLAVSLQCHSVRRITATI